MRVPGCYRNAIFLIISCFQFLLAGDLTIAVAANARYAVDKIVQEFEKDTNIQCRLVVASSGKLSAQIRNGAPFHLFLSADTSYPTALIRDKFAEPLLHIYAHVEKRFSISVEHRNWMMVSPFVYGAEI